MADEQAGLFVFVLVGPVFFFASDKIKYLLSQLFFAFSLAELGVVQSKRVGGEQVFPDGSQKALLSSLLLFHSVDCPLFCPHWRNFFLLF